MVSLDAAVMAAVIEDVMRSRDQHPRLLGGKEDFGFTIWQKLNSTVLPQGNKLLKLLLLGPTSKKEISLVPN